MARKFVIQSPVVDLRREPQICLPQDYSYQDMRETQLLFGEKVELIEQKGEWLKISALEQPYFNDQKGWQPYMGWIHITDIKEVDLFTFPTKAVCIPYLRLGSLVLSYGTHLTDVDDSLNIRSFPKNPSRELIVEDAKLFLGAPYLWGGRAFHLKEPISSVDCSGLINLLYRAQGIIIPRNAHDQYLRSKPTAKLLPGDPLYLAREKRVNHVVLKLNDKTFIESPETGKCVRTLAWGKEIWEDNGQIRIYDRPHSYTAYPSTFIVS